MLRWDRALSNFNGEEPILRRLLAKFKERATPTLDKIRRTARDGDLPTLQREAFSLKGSAGYIAASYLQGAATALEQAIEKQINAPVEQLRLGQFDEHIEACAREMVRVLHVIDAHLQAPEGSQRN